MRLSQRLRRGLTAATAAMCLVTSHGMAQATGPSDSDSLRPGDPVRIKVWREPELSGDFTVTPEGTLDHPRFDTVRVTGMSLREARARLRRFLGSEYNDPLLTVEPLLRVAVQGEVRQPSLYPMPRSTTVGQAIAVAGGLTDRGKLSDVRLIRGAQQIHLNLTKSSSTDATMPVRSGDQLIVGRHGNFFRDILTPLASLTAATVSVLVAIRQ